MKMYLQNYMSYFVEPLVRDYHHRMFINILNRLDQITPTFLLNKSEHSFVVACNYMCVRARKALKFLGINNFPNIHQVMLPVTTQGNRNKPHILTEGFQKVEQLLNESIREVMAREHDTIHDRFRTVFIPKLIQVISVVKESLDTHLQLVSFFANFQENIILEFNAIYPLN